MRRYSVVLAIFISATTHANPADPTQGYCQTVNPAACGWSGGSGPGLPAPQRAKMRYAGVAKVGNTNMVYFAPSSIRSSAPDQQILTQVQNDAMGACQQQHGQCQSGEAFSGSGGGYIAVASPAPKGSIAPSGYAFGLRDFNMRRKIKTAAIHACQEETLRHNQIHGTAWKPENCAVIETFKF